MTKRLLGLVVISTLGIVPVPASGASFSPPPEAEAWVGTWHTNQGDFQFTAPSGCQSPPAGQGVPSCKLDGEWQKPGVGTTAIQGFVFLGPKYKGEAWQGCTPLSPGTECGFNTSNSLDDLSIDRMGDKFTDGFWRSCPPLNPCTDHHPLLGKKVSGPPGPPPRQKCPVPPEVPKSEAASQSPCPDYEVRFAVTVDGFPDSPKAKDLPQDLATVEIKSEGTKLVWSPTSKDWTAEGKLKMTTTYIDPLSVPHIREDQTEIDLAGFHLADAKPPSYFQTPAKQIVSFTGEVASTLDDHCTGGYLLSISLAVAKKAAGLRFTPQTQGRGCPETNLDAPVIWSTHRFKHAHISKPIKVR